MLSDLVAEREESMGLESMYIVGVDLQQKESAGCEADGAGENLMRI